jgi:hypothetical protein
MRRLIAFSALAVAMALPAAGAELQLTPADDVQRALDAAAPGDTVVLKDGAAGFVFKRFLAGEATISNRSLRGCSG